MVTVLSGTLRRFAVPAASPRRMISAATRLPSRLSHQSASSSVDRNFGIVIGFSCFGIPSLAFKVQTLLPFGHAIPGDHTDGAATHGVDDCQQPSLRGAAKTEHAFFAGMLLEFLYQGFELERFLRFLRRDFVPGKVLGVLGVPYELHA